MSGLYVCLSRQILLKRLFLHMTLALIGEYGNLWEKSRKIAKKHFLQGIADGEIKGIEEGQSKLVDAIQRLREGESREEIIASGIDEHTVGLAEAVK